MEIRRWHYYVIFNCVILKYIDARTISLNEVITAESQQKQAFETTLPPKSENTDRRFSLIKRLKPTSRVNFLDSGSLLDQIRPLGGSKLSPLKYKKTYLIKSPLKPRKLKLLRKSRFKRRNQSAKHEINGNEELKQKYIPLLKSLSMLFDNLLNSDESESHEVKTKKFKRNRYYSGETFDLPPDFTPRFYSQEETVTVSPTLVTETTIVTEDVTTTTAASTTPNITTTRDFSAFRQNKVIPILLPRSTISGRRNYNGTGRRSGATRDGNIEGYITRHHGDHEHVPGCGENGSCSKDDEKYTNSDTRDGAGRFRLRRPTGSRNITRSIPRRNRTDSENGPKTETADDYNGEDQFKTGREKTESGRVLQESIRRLRGFTPKVVNEITESVQSKEVREEGHINVTNDIAGYQRISDESSAISTDDQEVRKGNETMILNSTSIYSHSKTSKKKSPVVMIFDGYSIARHNNKTRQVQDGVGNRGYRSIGIISI